jgi:thiol-disulfide isomerase/thioredoxin
MKNRLLITGSLVLLSLGAVAQTKGDNKAAVQKGYKDLMGIKDTSMLKIRIASLENSKNEDSLILAYQYYYSKSSKDKAAAIAKKAILQYPKGQFALSERSGAIKMEIDLEKKGQLFEKLVKDFPKDDHSFVAYEIAYAYAEAGNKDKMQKYASLYPTEELAQMNVMLAMALGKKDPVGAVPMMKVAIDSFQLRVKDTVKYGKTIERQKSLYKYSANIYADLLIRSGNPEAAYQFITPLYEENKEKEKAIYLDVLLATNRLKEAFPLIEESFTEGEATEEAKAKFRDAYVSVKGSDKGFDAYKTNIDKQLAETMKERVAKLAISEASINFTLKDINGKTVSLSDLKGKVVVLDFWATWCGPCKASFPSMQMAVNKYKDDSNVKFLFIHTLDKAIGDPVADARDYVVNNHYSFEVLMDLRDKETHRSKVAEAYKLEGIPAKLVIDTKGVVRFKLSGFGGRNEAAVSELSAMIEYAKQNS